jgi:hypothetical protein
LSSGDDASSAESYFSPLGWRVARYNDENIGKVRHASENNGLNENARGLTTPVAMGRGFVYLVAVID